MTMSANAFHWLVVIELFVIILLLAIKGRPWR